MGFALNRKKMMSIMLIAAMIWSIVGAIPLQTNAAAPTQVVLVGDLQKGLGNSENWDPKAEVTKMIDSGSGYYTFTATLPAGTYEYKVALNEGWLESYGFGNYTNPNGVDSGGNIKLTLSEAKEVTFYYNHDTHKIADSTYYKPIASDKLPRIVGSLQIPLGEPSNWAPESAQSLLTDADLDGVYTITKNVPKGDYKFKIVLGSSWDDKAYPKDDQLLSLPADLPVTFKYNTNTEVVTADFEAPVEPSPSPDPVDPNIDPIPANHLRIHYNRADANYEKYGVWTWEHVATPSAGWPLGATAFPDTKRDSYGAYVDIPLAANAQKVGLLIVNRSDGAKDAGDKAVAISSPAVNEIWIMENSDTVYWKEPELSKGLVSAEIVSVNKLLLRFATTAGLTADEMNKMITITDKSGAAVAVNQVTLNEDKKTVTLWANFQTDQAPLSVTYKGKTVLTTTGWRMLDELYNYEGNDLGASYSFGNVVLKLWAPKASSVVANVYDKDNSTLLVGSVDLTKGDKGVWTAAIAPSYLTGKGITDLKGYFYQYEVTNDGVAKQVLDPYAKSMAEFRVNTKGETGPDGDAVGKAAIVDLSETDPVADYDFAQIDGYEKREDAIIWEAHIRDFTSDPLVANDLNARWGSYSAFKDKLAYIKSLGVTHIQLLPVMAWYYGDEASMGTRETEYSAINNEYNWGYDPHSYFSPDGAYSEDAADPELRVKELKGLIDAIHDEGMGVVLDVVYTHMAKASFLNDIVPNYYAFQDANGNNIGGFGNNLATSHKMAEKLMVDSVKYWFDEYKIDGMRWDMMGDATYDSVQNAYDAAASINPNVLFIGEGWKTFGGAASDPALKDKGADQAWMDKTDNVGVFSDEIRNELKSGFGSEGEPRFITGGARSIATILNNIKGQPGNTPADDPGDMVQYIEAHDNLPLYDVIAQSIKKDPAIAANDLEIHKRIRLGNLLILTSQGTAFLHAGQEYGRTKQWLGEGTPKGDKFHELKDEAGKAFGYFIHDSYDSSDAINKFDWQKATNAEQYPVNHVTKEYTAGLIELRKHTDAFRLGEKDLVDSNVTLIPATEMKDNDLVIGYKNKATDGTGNYYVFMNADRTARTLTLTEDLTAGTVLVDNDEAGITAVSAPSGFELTASSITLEPLTAVIIKMEAAAPVLNALELDSANYPLQVGTTHQTVVYAKYSDGSKRKVTSGVVYSSNKPEIASVTTGGLVKANSLGNAIITATYNGISASAVVAVKTESIKRYVQINYIRPDKNYQDWNMWIWNTGVKNDQINFDKIENGIATVVLEISQDATNVGFVLRKGTDWDTAKQDIPDDRVIPISPGSAYTKVNITSMVNQLDILPTIIGPVLKDGGITFQYRDDVLFENGRSSDLTEVKVKVNGAEHEMVYDATKEWFTYSLANVEGGTYEYTFLVKKKDEAAVEITDPKNTTNGKSIITYRKPVVTMTTSVNPAEISYHESAVLKIQASASEEVAFTEGYMDLTAVGGLAKVPIDTKLLAQTIAVKDTVTAGVKEIPVTLIDEYGNKHTHTGTVTVKARTFAGNLDFDWDEARIYFALTDRFADGDSTNNADVDKDHLEAYHGGDFRGMIDKLDYLQELGINTLWITPIVDNIDFNKGVDFNSKQYGYHGYWAKDFTKLDEHLGDMDTFKELINKAHDMGIKVMVDVVLNHTGYGLKADESRPGITPEDKARFAGMLRTNGVQANINPIEGELDGLPDFKTEDPAVREKIIEWQAGWLERARTDRGDTIDFFRVDTVKHVESTTWKAFKNALTTIDPSFKLIGENFGGTIDGDGGMLRSGQMDSLLDFSFNNRAKDFTDGKIDIVDAYLADRETKLDNTTTMGQFLSSHDEDGFLSEFVNGDKGKLKIAAALQITAKGQPVIYYGEELGRSGPNARDMGAGLFSENRSDMPWDQLTTEQALHDHYEKLLNIRAKFSKVYSKGLRTKLAGSDALAYLAFNKQFNGVNIVTIINTAVESKSVALEVPFTAGAKAKDEYSGTLYTVKDNRQVTVEVPGRNEGGTVILSEVVDNVPTPMAPSTPQPADVQVIDNKTLRSGKDGKVSVQIADGKHLVQLPLDAAAVLAGNNLELKAAGITMTLSNELLASMNGLVSVSEADGARIVFEAKALKTADVDALVDRTQDVQAKLKAGSLVYDFNLSIVTKVGKVIPVTKFEKPIILNFQLNANANKDIVGIYYVSEDGKLEYIGGTLKGEVITAEVFHFSKYAVLEYDKSFTDVPASHWANTAIKSLAAKHIVSGINETQFAPQANVTRAEFTAMLIRALGEKAEGTASYSDVEAGKWYSAYVATASKLGLIKGRSDTKFAPNETISREEMAVLIMRAYEVRKGTAAASAAEEATFTDRSQISKWAEASVAAAAKLGLVEGRENETFVPKGKMTRAESAQVIYKLLSK
ncbi:alpha-amylase family glycosyl hydrolase [Bacillus sp. FJAT-28004]|uniref:alpha-amylase family glycosyl hydrolase n=1 Tax=Bacillus sp. FJAT-28004 TaxID=1679165 RepID=UPI0006B5EDA3|nr:alpha-amylase family glycosyl hydrolase [Bacillus sp. FJAT-28004]